MGTKQKQLSAKRAAARSRRNSPPRLRVGLNDRVAFGDEVMLTVGRVTAIFDHGFEVTEAHSFHSMWGGSDGGRGTKHLVDPSKLTIDDTYCHITDKYIPEVK